MDIQTFTQLIATCLSTWPPKKWRQYMPTSDAMDQWMDTVSVRMTGLIHFLFDLQFSGTIKKRSRKWKQMQKGNWKTPHGTNTIRRIDIHTCTVTELDPLCRKKNYLMFAIRVKFCIRLKSPKMQEGETMHGRPKKILVNWSQPFIAKTAGKP